jgi:hypothetical protein
MDKTILGKSLLNGVIAWILIALILFLLKGMAFTQALTAPYTIFMAIAAVIGSYIGYMRKPRR